VADPAQLEARLGYAFRDHSLLKLALTHPSVAHEPGVPVLHNQRLEYLGDAVLQLVLTGALYERFPEFGEGPLTKARAKLVNRRALAVHGSRLSLGEHLILSRGEELHGGRERASALADAFEAVMGALFLDGGYAAARDFILRDFGDLIAMLQINPSVENPKGELQELLQSRSPVPPQYHVVSATGPDHARTFECTVHHEGRELARGTGKSKKSAESEAALAALRLLRNPEPAEG
jgi:ribonuclease-3